MEAARALVKSGFTGAVLEGDFDGRTAADVRAVLEKSRREVVQCGARGSMRLDGEAPIVATVQGVWPGIRVADQRALEAGPTSAPWIDTNTGFLRFARASTNATIWMANRPPPDLVIPIQHYLQAIGDAAINQARWVLALEDEFWDRLLARDTKTLAQWREIGAGLQHYEDHRDWRGAGPSGGIAVRGNASTAVVEMLASRNLPVFASPSSDSDSHRASMAIDAPAQSTTTALEEIWKKVETITSERNMGVRLHNVTSVRSNLLAMPGQKQLILHLVNYSDYPVQGISVRVLGSFRHARLFRPGIAAMDLDVYKSEDGTGFDIEGPIGTLATVVIE